MLLGKEQRHSAHHICTWHQDKEHTNYHKEPKWKKTLAKQRVMLLEQCAKAHNNLQYRLLKIFNKLMHRCTFIPFNLNQTLLYARVQFDLLYNLLQRQIWFSLNIQICNQQSWVNNVQENTIFWKFRNLVYFNFSFLEMITIWNINSVPFWSYNEGLYLFSHIL